MSHHIDTEKFHEMVKDFIGYKLLQNNIFIDDLTIEIPTTCSIAIDKVIAGYSDVFRSMCDNLRLTSYSVNSNFIRITNELFQSGRNWGRVVIFLAFGATLAVYCAQRDDLRYKVKDIVAWVLRYMDQNLSCWIRENGGWNRFIYFVQPSDRRGFKMLRLFGLGFGLGVGVGALFMLSVG